MSERAEPEYEFHWLFTRSGAPSRLAGDEWQRLLEYLHKHWRFLRSLKWADIETLATDWPKDPLWKRVDARRRTCGILAKVQLDAATALSEVLSQRGIRHIFFKAIAMQAMDRGAFAGRC